MDYIIGIIGVIIILVWTIRPFYNVFSRNKYILLDQKNNSMKKRVLAGLPAVAFYAFIISVMFLPSSFSEMIGASEAASLIFLQVIIIFILTRFDKRQTKYDVTNKGIKFKKKGIKWTDIKNITFKKSFLVVLHKPRFIVRSRETKIVIPLLSKNIHVFIDALSHFNKGEGDICNKIFDNLIAYHIENTKLTKLLNKTSTQ